MKAEAETNAEADRREKEEIEKVNQADNLIFQTEKQLKEYGDKIPADKKANIENALNDLKEAHKQRNITAIDSAMTRMNQAWQAASEEMYKATQQSSQQEPHYGNENQGKSDGPVEDTDFEEVK